MRRQTLVFEKQIKLFGFPTVMADRTGRWIFGSTINAPPYIHRMDGYRNKPNLMEISLQKIDIWTAQHRIG